MKQIDNTECLIKCINDYVKEGEWASVAQLATMLNTGEWDDMSDEEQAALLEEME